MDLGSGSGRDCYVLSQLVGEKGHVTGIDMTEVQVRQRFGGKGEVPLGRSLSLEIASPFSSW